MIYMLSLYLRVAVVVGRPVEEVNTALVHLLDFHALRLNHGVCVLGKDAREVLVLVFLWLLLNFRHFVFSFPVLHEEAVLVEV